MITDDDIPFPGNPMAELVAENNKLNEDATVIALKIGALAVMFGVTIPTSPVTTEKLVAVMNQLTIRAERAHVNLITRTTSVPHYELRRLIEAVLTGSQSDALASARQIQHMLFKD
jgi:hypothetical protein